MAHTEKQFDTEELLLREPALRFFHCRLLCPMFMFGANNRNPAIPELREEAIIGALHYWYRALWGHAKPLATIRQEENRLFGSTQQKGMVRVRIFDKQLTSGNTSYKPHRPEEREFTKPAFQSGGSFSIAISEEASELFLLTALLGGFGGRSRRGFGAVEVVSEDMDADVPLATNLVGRLRQYLGNPQLRRTEFEEGIEQIILPVAVGVATNHFPYVKAIYFEENPTGRSPLAAINQLTSTLTGRYPNQYSRQMGGTRPRFASPLIVTLANDRKMVVPVVTQLYNPQTRQDDIQSEYIRSLLNPAL